MKDREAVTEKGTFENQFNRKMNQLIKAVESPRNLKLRELIEMIEDMDALNRTNWVNRIIVEFKDDITMKTLLEVKKGE